MMLWFDAVLFSELVSLGVAQQSIISTLLNYETSLTICYKVVYCSLRTFLGLNIRHMQLELECRL